MPDEKIRIWSFCVHQRFNETLLYYLLRVRPYKKDDFHSRIRDFLSKRKLGGYCLYQIYGSYDILLRVWLPPTTEMEFSAELQSELSCVRQVNPFRVQKQASCWAPQQSKRAKVDIKQLDELTIDKVRKTQNGEPEPAEQAVKSGLFYLYDNRFAAKQKWLKFFTGIVVPHGLAVEAFEDLVGKVLDILDKHIRKKEFDRPSVYIGYGFATMLIKAETKNFYNIAPLVVELGDMLAIIDGGSTLTHVVANSDPTEVDDVSEAAFDEMQAVDLAVNAVLPRIYDPLTEIEGERKDKIVTWVRNKIVSHGFSDDQLESIRGCFDGIIDLKEELIETSMMRLFSKYEKWLRSNRSHFVTKLLGKEANVKILREAKIVETKNTKYLSLGDLFDVYAVALKKQNSFSVPRDLLRDKQDFANLRNKVAHGEAELLPDWDEKMNLFIEFLTHFGALSDIITGVIEKNIKQSSNKKQWIEEI